MITAENINSKRFSKLLSTVSRWNAECRTLLLQYKISTLLMRTEFRLKNWSLFQIFRMVWQSLQPQYSSKSGDCFRCCMTTSNVNSVKKIIKFSLNSSLFFSRIVLLHHLFFFKASHLPIRSSSFFMTCCKGWMRMWAFSQKYWTSFMICTTASCFTVPISLIQCKYTRSKSPLDGSLQPNKDAFMHPSKCNVIFKQSGHLTADEDLRFISEINLQQSE